MKQPPGYVVARRKRLTMWGKLVGAAALRHRALLFTLLRWLRLCSNFGGRAGLPMLCRYVRLQSGSRGSP